MSSASDYKHSEPSEDSSDESSRPPTRPTSRRQSSTSHTPRKRRRLESIDPARVRKYYLEGKYNDAYRVLFNEDVTRAAARFETDAESFQYYNTQIGASYWSAQEQAVFFAALERLGRDDIPGIARAIGTKSIPETQELLLLLQDAATRQGDAKVTLRDVPAAIDVGDECNEQLDLAGEALAWMQEVFEASQERERFGDYWLITPAVADKIESAHDTGRDRATTSPPASEPEPSRRGGRVVVGACISCKKFKQKCDRATPCANCVRRNTGECIYPEQSLKPEVGDQSDKKAPKRKHGILEDIPEATLLHPQVMLILSKTVFMNRSPTIPSPWPHWSEYTSELAREPSIYRTAFNDFHTLVLSVTKRLVQTALIQATSRLRSQRHRVKGGIPLVKKRDVLTAIDIVGMQQNGQERWKGVARRCALRVYEGKWSRYRRNNTKREVPWDEVEQIMTPAESSIESQTTDAETSGNETPDFSARAKRSGTPLPFGQLALSDSDEESLVGESEPPSRSASQSRDIADQPTNPPADMVPEKPGPRKLTLGEFDREISRREEHALWDMLDLEPTVKLEEANIGEESDEDDPEESEKITTLPDGWRSWTPWRTEWEEFDTPPPETAFLANQKTLDVPPILQGHSSDTAESSSDGDTDAPTQKPRHQSKPSIQQTVELQTRGTHAYAALQGQSSKPVGSPSESSSQDEDTSDDNAQDHGLPRPPIDDTRVEVPTSESSDDSSDSSDSESQLPTQSIEDNKKPTPSVGSSEVSTDIEMDQPVRSIEPHSTRVPAPDSDDEPKEMDWESFIQE
ncbi:uncharacterized protein J4E92_009632 [Alternaria infectoria]|uniref:uncharacterized protein n=1 Tax=Alternaria infectoria TaxID=45303 RepID=UPI00221E65F0|nr:uncharacterized protein J4E92_009632 [Alternaria infectoria]KAI4914219.1 hypothetical protein J4E92_009632 [Alternaria infectoria]